MTVPTYDKFTESVLRCLATRPEGVTARDVHEAAADISGPNDSQRARVIANGQFVYKSRVDWAHDRSKRTGSSQSLSRGKWCLTPASFDWIASYPQPMTEQETNHLTFAFVNVKLKSRSDTTDLDPKAGSPDYEELARSSPDDRLDQALKEFRDAVADEVLENLLQVSSSRFEVIILDVLHRLGCGDYRDDLQCVGGTGDSGTDGVISLDKPGLEKIYVQTKRWQSTVGRPELQTLYDALAGQKTKRRVFITVSGFTSQACNFAQSVKDMILIDGKCLTHLMTENEAGVSSRLLKVPELNTDYFK